MVQRARPVVLPLVLATVVAALAAPSRAQDTAPPWDPAAASGGPMTILDAVRLTLENAPSIRLRSEEAHYARGVAQEQTGAFDLSILGNFTYEYTQEELTAAEKNAEEARRESYRESAVAAGAEAQDLELLRDSIDRRLLADDECLAAGTCDVCTAPAPPPVTDDYIQAQLLLLDDLIADACAVGDLTEANLLAATRDGWLYELKPIITEDAEDAREEEADNIQKLERMGDIPEVEQTYTGALDLSLRQPFRTGVVVTPYLNLSVDGTGYRGKPKDVELGGKGIPDLYRAVIGFDVELPLGRGRGVESAGAAERAANVDYEASLAAITHAASVSVYDTVLAYWNLVGAQQSLAAWEQSLDLQSRLVELTQALIDADELARVEITQAQARRADLQGQVDAARRRVYAARVDLARVIGLEVVDGAQVPSAADSFPTPPPVPELERLAFGSLPEQAVARRYDYRAARQLQESGKILLRAAEIDLAPDATLTLGLSTSGLDEDANVLDGLEGALFGRWVGPSAKVGLAVDWPLANNTQLGRLTQQDSLYRQRAISTVDLERTIKANVVLASGQLKEAAVEMQRNAEAVELYRTTVANELEKLRLGSSTVIDALYTEQRLTDATLALVASQLRYAQILAALRYESGTLISDQPDGKLVKADSLVTLPEPTTGGTP